LKQNHSIVVRILFLTCILMLAGIQRTSAQIEDEVPIDSITRLLDKIPVDSIDAMKEQILSTFSDENEKVSSVVIDSVMPLRTKKAKKDWSQWRPDPQRALWLALVIPGGGQIYNRKYWKLPIVYGGFIGCIYAMNWNNTMYKDYAQAYLDLMDNDPHTQSYNQFLHLGATIKTDADKKRYEDIFRKRRDKYRRWRDLSFFVMLGVYALSVIDAYVDAELSVFDISKDLSLKVEPTIINTNTSVNPIKSSSVGLQCSLNF
jgi:hypothetical protein